MFRSSARTRSRARDARAMPAARVVAFELRARSPDDAVSERALRRARGGEAAGQRALPTAQRPRSDRDRVLRLDRARPRLRATGDPPRPAEEGGRERGHRPRARGAEGSRGAVRPRGRHRAPSPRRDRRRPTSSRVAGNRTTGGALADRPLDLRRQPLDGGREVAIAIGGAGDLDDRPSHRSQAESALAEVEDGDDRNFSRAGERGRADRQLAADGRTPGPGASWPPVRGRSPWSATMSPARSAFTSSRPSAGSSSAKWVM